MPSSPKGWLNWAVSVREWYLYPRAGRYDAIPHADWRTNDMRETSISIIRLLEKSANGNGGGRLVYLYFVEEHSWWSFSEPEQAVLRKTIRAFSRRLWEEGFLPEYYQRGYRRQS